jgi:hypothetical protein
MPAYNSQIKSGGHRQIGNVPLLPLKQTAKNVGRGVAPVPASNAEPDIVDESLDLFKVSGISAGVTSGFGLRKTLNRRKLDLTTIDMFYLSTTLCTLTFISLKYTQTHCYF